MREHFGNEWKYLPAKSYLRKGKQKRANGALIFSLNCTN